jgi:cell division protein FtsQ
VWQAMIGQYNINNVGQLELIPRLGNSTILLGDNSNLEKKIKQLDVFYFDVLRKVGWDYYKVINIMYKNQVVCIK